MNWACGLWEEKKPSHIEYRSQDSKAQILRPGDNTFLQTPLGQDNFQWNQLQAD